MGDISFEEVVRDIRLVECILAGFEEALDRGLHRDEVQAPIMPGISWSCDKAPEDPFVGVWQHSSGGMVKIKSDGNQYIIERCQSAGSEVVKCEKDNLLSGGYCNNTGERMSDGSIQWSSGD